MRSHCYIMVLCVGHLYHHYRLKSYQVIRKIGPIDKYSDSRSGNLKMCQIMFHNYQYNTTFCYDYIFKSRGICKSVF